MVQYERSRMVGVSGERWTRIGATSALVGGGLLALSGITMHSVLSIGQATMAAPFFVANYGPGIVFLGFLLGLLITMIRTLVLGITALRSDDSTIPRLGAWLLIAALPLGLPFTIAFTGYVMGVVDSPWAGPMLLYGLAWIVLGTYLRTHHEDAASVEAIPQ